MSNAAKSLKCATSGVLEDLPDTKEVHCFKEKLLSILTTTPHEEGNERLLKEATLAYLIIFNKRRASEVAKLRTSSWEQRSKWKKMR